MRVWHRQNGFRFLSHSRIARQSLTTRHSRSKVRLPNLSKIRFARQPFPGPAAGNDRSARSTCAIDPASSGAGMVRCDFLVSRSCCPRESSGFLAFETMRTFHASSAIANQSSSGTLPSAIAAKLQPRPRREYPLTTPSLSRTACPGPPLVRLKLVHLTRLEK